MRKKMSRGFLFVLLLCVGAVLGQNRSQNPDAEKLKAERRSKLIASIAREASELTLPENSAVISARLGAAIWKEDPERAGKLFRDAIGSLVTAQNLAETTKNSNQQNYELLNSQSTRPTVLNAIAPADAEFALESLYKTRPIAVQKALAQGTRNSKINGSGSNSTYLAQQEINLEQRFIRLLAEQKPQRSVEMLKESIKKQLSAETLAMLKKLWEKDPTAANELANTVVDRLISTQFVASNNQVNYELLNVSNAILGESTRERSPEEKGIAFDESRLRSLAQKVIATYTEYAHAMGYVPLEVIDPIAKRFGLSAQYAQLKKVSETLRGFGHGGGPSSDPEYTKLMASDPSAETLMSEAKKFPPDTRRSIYQTAANKLSDSGQYDRAVALLNDQFEDDALENAISSLNWYYAHLLVNRGDFDGAEAMMMQFNDSNRISALTSLAMTIYNKDQKENRARANAILQRVRSLLPEKPETSTEFSQLFQLIGVMTTIDPAEGFRHFEPVVDRINELTEAWAVVNAFQGGNIRRGEYLLNGGYNIGIYIDPSMINKFAQEDFTRTMGLIDGFSRREMRITLAIGLLESGI